MTKNCSNYIPNGFKILFLSGLEKNRKTEDMPHEKLNNNKTKRRNAMKLKTKLVSMLLTFAMLATSGLCLLPVAAEADYRSVKYGCLLRN